MSLEPLLTAPWFVQAHAFGAIAAFFLGAYQLWAPKGTMPHRLIGGLWVAIMIVVVGTSALIQHPIAEGDPFYKRFSFIHAFTILGIFSLSGGVIRLLLGGKRLKGHAGPFTGLFIGGLIVAGLLAFMPGRLMHEVVFGG